MNTEQTARTLFQELQSLSANKSLQIIDEMLEGIQIFDKDLIYLYINKAAERQNQRSNKELIGKRYEDSWVGIEKTQVYKKMRQCLSTHRSTQFENEFKFPDGSAGWFHLSIQPINEGILILSLDITTRVRQEKQLLATQSELKRLLTKAEKSRLSLLKIVNDQKLAQKEISQLNKTLEERVNHRTTQLMASNEELESFAYSISHDLRAPLRAIDGYSRILEQEYAKALDSEGLRLLGIVRSSTKNLDRLITDILSLSRVGRSELKKEVLDMNSMVKSVYQELTAPETQDKMKFTIHDLPEGYGDPTLVRQVWMNLISNAIQYSAPKDHPSIEVCGKSEPEKWTYTIKDNGVGFNPEYKDKLFTLFQRLHKASEFEGTGVGLAIVHRIVTRHNGEVWGNGETNIGAEFSFTLPKKSFLDEK